MMSPRIRVLVATALAAAFIAPGCGEKGTSVVVQQIGVDQTPDDPGQTPNFIVDNDKPSDEEHTPREPVDIASLCVEMADCTACDTDASCAVAVGTLPRCMDAQCQQVCVVKQSIDAECGQPTVPANTLCGVGGAAGSTAVCDISVVRENGDVPPLSQLAFDLNYNPAAVEFLGFRLPNPADGRSDWVPPTAFTSTGHYAVTTPAEVMDWRGMGNLAIKHADPDTGMLLNAYQDAAEGVMGNPVILQAVFRMKHPIQAPIWVTLDSIEVDGLRDATVYAEVKNQTLWVKSTRLQSALVQQAVAPGATKAITAATICDVAGPAGSARDCLIRVARQGTSSDMPTRLDMMMQFDAARIELESFHTRECIEPDQCSESMAKIGNALLLPSGHSLVATPSPMEGPGMEMRIIVEQPGAKDQAITASAVGPDEKFTSDPLVAWMRFRLKSDVSPNEPAWVQLMMPTTGSAIATAANGKTLPLEVHQGMLITGAAGN